MGTAAADKPAKTSVVPMNERSEYNSNLTKHLNIKRNQKIFHDPRGIKKIAPMCLFHCNGKNDVNDQ